MKVKSKRILVILLILIFATAIMIGLKSMRPEPKKKQRKDATLLIDTFELEKSEVTFEIDSQGTVKPKTQTILSAEVSGRIIHISDKFVTGGIFRKDEVLMQIDPTDYQVAVDQSEALLQQRQIEFNGAKSLQKKGYRAEAEFAAAKTALAAAKSALVKAKKKLDRTQIRLPYDGMVKSKDSDLGQYVNPGSRLGITFATDRAEIRLALTDQDLAFLDLPEASHLIAKNENNKPVVRLSAIRKGKYQEWLAQVIRTEGIIDEKSRVTYAVAQIDDPYRLNSQLHTRRNLSPLPIGAFVRATIMGNSYSNVIKVPRIAVRGKDELLFIDNKNRLNIRKINILRADTDYVYVSDSSISGGERISLTAIESPINGMKVRTGDVQPEPQLVEKSDDTSSETQMTIKDE